MPSGPATIARTTPSAASSTPPPAAWCARLIVACGLILLSAGAPPVHAQEEFAPIFRPEIEIRPAAGAIQVDGELDDPGWVGAACADNFAEHSPRECARPPVHSEAWITYDDQNFYVALIAHDDPATVRVSHCERDNIFRDDYYGVMIDTYGDLAWAYEFFVNPLGLQGDLRVDGDGSEEIAFDVVWESKGRVTDRGYQVELAIPFSSLRFPDREEQVWRFNIWRDHQREVRRRYSWAAIDRDLPCWLCQWGTLRGIRGIRPGSNADIIATAVGHRVGERTDWGDPHAPFEQEDPAGRASLNVRYGLTSSSSAELTINPDFSQIESDAAQIDVNTTFALFYPERRPFFQEGSDLYNTWINAIYTRSINDPWAAAKFTGTFGRTTLLYLLARDRNSPVLIPGEQGSYQPLLWNGFDEIKSVSNILRVRRTLLEDSYVGATITDRRFEGQGGGAGSLMGIDSRIRFLTNYHLELQVMASHTSEPQDTLLTEGINEETFDSGDHTFGFDGEEYWGHAVYASLERGARHWSVDVDYWEYSPTFRTDNGFTQRNDYRRVILSGGLSYQPNRRLLVQWGPSMSLGRFWTHAGSFKEDWVNPHLWFEFVGQTSLAIGGSFGRENWRGTRFDDLASGFVEISTRPTEMLSLGVAAERSRTIYRTADQPRLTNALYISVWSSWKLLQRLRLEPSMTYFRMDERHGGDNLFDGSIVRGRLTYQFTREFHARVIVQYDSFDDQLNFEPLLTYRINPFTVFYVGAASSDMHYAAGAGADEESGLPGISEERWKPVVRQYFAKIQYLLRI